MSEEVYKPEVGKVYRHFQTGVLFRVDHNGYYMETNEPGVVITNLEDEQIYVCPLDHFYSLVQRPEPRDPRLSENVPRFKRVD